MKNRHQPYDICLTTYDLWLMFDLCKDWLGYSFECGARSLNRRGKWVSLSGKWSHLETETYWIILTWLYVVVTFQISPQPTDVNGYNFGRDSHNSDGWVKIWRHVVWSLYGSQWVMITLGKGSTRLHSVNIKLYWWSALTVDWHNRFP